jgi:hypothetical protein
MKKLLSLYIVGLLVFSGVGVIAITNDNTTDMKITTETIVIPEPVFDNEGQYVTVTLQAATSSLLDSGNPKLPVITKVYTFPFGTKICDVTVNFTKLHELVISKKVYPAPEPTSVGRKVANIPIQDSTTYESAEVYPAQWYSYTTGAGLDGKEHVIYLAVNCYPIRYSPANNILYYHELAEIQITYEEPTTQTVFFDQYDLVVISPSEFSNQLQPLVDHKIRKGINTLLKTTEEIYSAYSGRDNAEKIKYFIKDALETFGIDYVLLVGDVNKLPIRASYASPWEATLLTDLYYADIYNSTGGFCNWDKDGDGKYGEVVHNDHQYFDIDDVDLYPDVTIGRLPCTKSAEVTTVVNKIIYYETETYGESWFKKIILVGGDTFPGWGENEGEDLNLMNEQIMSEFTATKLWTSDGTFTAKLLNQAINNGAGFIDYSGHGFEIGVATHPPNSDAWVPYHTNHLLGAKNGYKLPIVFFDACLTAKLDFDVSNLTTYLSRYLINIFNKFNIGSKLIPCFAWCCVAKSSGGCIASIGATRTAYGGVESGAGKMSLEFFSAYNSSVYLGQMMTRMQNEYIIDVQGDLFTVEEFILIGDPSLMIGGYE